jgi:hypothetical protein
MMLEVVMAIFSNQTIRNQRIVLDDNTYSGCVLENCEIVYRGGEVRIDFDTRSCRWIFEGAALSTIKFLQATGMLPTDPKQWVIVPTKVPKQSIT